MDTKEIAKDLVVGYLTGGGLPADNDVETAAKRIADLYRAVIKALETDVAGGATLWAGGSRDRDNV